MSLDYDIELYTSFIANYNSDTTSTKNISLERHTIDLLNNTTETYDAKETAAKVFDDVQKKKQDLNNPPRYFKPAFLLESPTPRIHVKILLRKPGGKIVMYDLFNQTTNPSLDNLNPQPVHNYIKSFTYEVIPKGSDGLKGNGTLEIIDIDSSLVEAFMLRYTQLAMSLNGSSNISDNSIMVEVEYGWYVPETVEADYKNSFGNSASVKFTDKLIFILLKPELKYNMNGTINCTLHMSANPNLMPPFTWWRPYETLGRMPIQNIAMTFFLMNMMQIRSKNLSKSDSTFIIELGKWIYLEYCCGTGSTVDLNLILKSIMPIFEITDVKVDDLSELHVNNLQSLASKVWDNKSNNKYNSKIYGGKLSGISYNTINPAELLTVAVGYNSANVNESYIGSYRSVLANGIKVNQPAINNKPLEKALYNTIYSGDNTISFETNFKAMLYNAEQLDDGKVSFNKLTKFINTIGPILNDWQVHPFLAYTYILEKFWYEYSTQIDIIKSLKINFISMINDTQLLPTGIYDSITSSDPSDTLLLTRAEKEQYCHKVSEYNINGSDTWIDLIQRIMELMKINFEVSDDKSGQILTGDSNFTLTDPKTKQSILSKKIPTKLHSHAFVTNSKGAIENIEKLLILLHGRLDSINSHDANSRVKKEYRKLSNEQIKIITNDIADFEDQLNLAKSTIVDSSVQWAFILKDILNEDIFRADIGQTTLLQAYSYRGNTSSDFNSSSQWNPGYPSMWDVNFPDMLSFEPTMDFFQAISNITGGIKPLKVIAGSINVMDDYNHQVQEAQEKGTMIMTEIITESDKTEQKAKVQELQTILDTMNSLKLESLKKKTQSKYPMTFNTNPNYKVTNNGSVPEVLAAKKTTQILRNKIMLSGIAHTAKQVVLGDPSFVCSDHGDLIFNKILNSDGSLSIFTGLYHLLGCTQKISNGSFTTELDLMYDPSTDINVADAMYTGIYNNDNMVITKK